MALFLSLVVAWMLLILGSRWLLAAWRRHQAAEPARYLGEVGGVAYYRSLPDAEFEALVLRALEAHGYTLLNDPFLKEQKDQGFAWKKGKKCVIAARREARLGPESCLALAHDQRRVKADRVLVLSPFDQAPRRALHGVQVLSGRQLVGWFKVLDGIRPPLAGRPAGRQCECSAPMVRRVSRVGSWLLVCSRYPDCRSVAELGDPLPTGSGDRPPTPPNTGTRVALAAPRSLP